MKQLFKAFVGLCMAIMMAFSVITVAAAEDTAPEEGTPTTSISDNDDTRAYQLVWKYKYQNGHVYKRRWNNTLNEWYDPAWILVK